jgi:predicted dehydrogenase
MYRPTPPTSAMSHSSLPRLALIGVTGYGSIYVGLLREALRANSVRLVAAVVIDPAQASATVAELRAGGTAIYGSADELFEKEAGNIDLCLIPTGIQWHARMTIAALAAGMNVLVEKPLAGSVADCTAVRQAEVAAGRWVAVGFQDLYAREVHRLKGQILGGAIGRLREVRMIGLWPRPRAYFTRNHWAGRRAADGAAVLDSPLNNAFAHFINLGLFIAGSSADVSARFEVKSAELYRAQAIEMFDTAVVRGVSDGGVRFWCGFSHDTETTREPEIHFLGDAGRIEWRHEATCVTTSKDGRREVVKLPDTSACRSAMFAAVLARLTDSTAFVCGTAIAERHSAFIEAVQHAAGVRSIPASLIEWRADAVSRSEIPCVRGLADALDRAFAGGTLLGAPEGFGTPSLVDVQAC